MYALLPRSVRRLPGIGPLYGLGVRLGFQVDYGLKDGLVAVFRRPKQLDSEQLDEAFSDSPAPT